MNKKSARRVVAAVAALGAVGGAALWGASAASAATTGLPQCDAAQLSVTIVPGEPGAGNRYASLQFTALPGQYCELTGALPITLAYAAGVQVVLNDAGAAPVDLAPGDSANELMHWAAVQAPEDQVIPGSVTVRTAGPLGDTVTLPWQGGPVDDYVDGTVHDNVVNVSAVAPGPVIDN